MANANPKQVKLIKILPIREVNYLVVDGEGFDWAAEDFSARINQDPAIKNNCIGSIIQHFVKCFSEFIGKQVTLKEINIAIKQGFIEV